MKTKLCILDCHNFNQEIEAAIAAEGWDDVVSVEFPARCGRPEFTWEEIRRLLPAWCTQLLILGSVCLSGLSDPPQDLPPLRLLPQRQCFDLVAPSSLVNQAIDEGGYLITAGWLTNWRGQLAKLGFDQETAREFFKDFAHRIVFLDTGVDANASLRFAELANIVGLPTLHLAVGLDTLRLLLTRAVLEWRLDEERRAAKKQKDQDARKLADHEAAMDMLASLSKTQQETEAVAAIEELFRMLFAPAIWHYVRIDRGKPIIDPAMPADLQNALRQLDSPYAWTPSQQGFLLRIATDEHLLGVVLVDNFAFPAYREHYLNLALAMTGIFALAIENARIRKRLVEAEKLASLGVMVAGVAHEINTPLGVSLIVATLLQEQSRQLSQRVTQRSMTLSDLENYLKTVLSETERLRRNLERIGQLTDAFRLVAIEGKPLSKRRFRLKTCLDDIITSLSKELSPERIDLQINCDRDLEVESNPGDWVSIFTNLITNSLQHGFKGREHGRIEIGILTRGEKLLIDYADDGIGVSRETLDCLFNPFFTTDLQHGCGLGMFLVYNLVTQRLGGSIDCDSQVGHGLHFHIETPL